MKGVNIGPPPISSSSSSSTKKLSSPLKSRLKTADLTIVRKLFKELQRKQSQQINNDNSDDDDNDSSSSNSSNDKKSEKVIKQLQDQFTILSSEYREIELYNDKYKQEITQLKRNNNDLVMQLDEAKKGVLDLLENFRILQKRMIEVTKKKEEREEAFKALLNDSKEKAHIVEELKKKDDEIKENSKLMHAVKGQMGSLLSKNNLLQISLDNIQNKLELSLSKLEEMNAKVNNKDIIISKLRKDVETSENNSYR